MSAARVSTVSAAIPLAPGLSLSSRGGLQNFHRFLGRYLQVPRW